MTSDLRTRLERLGERALPAPDAFERLARVRRRRERTRRITAGMVALLLTVGGTFVAFNAIDTGDGRALGTGDRFFALWPEQTSEALASVQESVDAGDPDLAWRTDPFDVARRFATDALLWPGVEIDKGLNDFGPPHPDLRFVTLRVPNGSDCGVRVKDAACPTGPTIITMRRFGGLWSVVDVRGDDLVLPLTLGEEVVTGTTITVPTNLSDGEIVSMGVAFLAACDTTGRDENVEASGGQLEFQVPSVPDGCTGYVYAMRPSTGVGAVAIGSFLFTDAEAVPAIGYLVQELSAVPVRFVDTAPAAVAEFTCGDTGTISPTRAVVAARADGVPIAVANVGGSRLAFSVVLSDGQGTFWAVEGGELESGVRAENVWQLPPETVTVQCHTVPAHGAGLSSSAILTVTDPSGAYVPAELECSRETSYRQAPSYIEGATGFVGDPVQVARDHVSGLEYDDAVERAGYPAGAESIVRVLRDGVVAGKITLFDDGAGGWLVSSIEGCANTRFGWSEQPTGVSGATGSTGSVFLTLCQPGFASVDPINIHDGPDLHVDGSDLRFDTACLSAPAGAEVTILFSNLDVGVQRNISVYAMAPCLEAAITSGTAPSCPFQPSGPLMAGEIVTGVDEIVYRLGPLDVGTYYFQDDVHPQANGVLIVV